MELEDYQPMMVEATKVCRGARYQNLWWAEEPSRQTNCAIHFWIYWEALQEAAVAVPRISTYTVAKYQRIIQFAVSPHSIHIQVRSDLDKQWLPFPYKITTEDLDVIVQDWLGD